MEIILASNAGFCYGVKNALKKAEELKTDKNIYTYGELIHNQQEIDRLKAKHIIPVEKIDELKDNDYLVIRSHGVGKSFYEKYGNREKLDRCDLSKCKNSSCTSSKVYESRLSSLGFWR